jgi:hypothetical protein
MQEQRFRLRVANVLVMIVFAIVAPLAKGCTAIKGPTPEAVQPTTPPPPPSELQTWNPLITSDTGGRVYLTFYSGPGSLRRGLSFARSLDQGLTWSGGPIVLEPVTPPRSRIGFHKLERDGKGNVYVTWSIEFPVEMGRWRTREVRRRHSSDFGATWSEPPTIWRPDGKQLFLTPLTGGDGEFSLAWTQQGQGKAEDLFFSKTTQGGHAWRPNPVRVNTPGEHSTPSEPPARKGAQVAAWPSLVSDDHGNLFMAWDETRNRLPDVFFSRSADGGTTWLAQDMRLNTAPTGKWTARMPVLAADGNAGVYAIWGDSRDGGEDVYFNRSLDHGTTWLREDIRISPQRSVAERAASDPSLYSDKEGRLYIHWIEDWEAPRSIYFTRSVDRGSTWLLPPTRLDYHGQEATSGAVRLAHDEAGHLYVVWWNLRQDNTSTILFNRSDDFGNTWLPKPIRLDTDPEKKNGKPLGPRFPRISTDGNGTVYVTWSSDRDGQYQVFLNRSTDHGATWLRREIQVVR